MIWPPYVARVPVGPKARCPMLSPAGPSTGARPPLAGSPEGADGGLGLRRGRLAVIQKLTGWPDRRRVCQEPRGMAITAFGLLSHRYAMILPCEQTGDQFRRLE